MSQYNFPYKWNCKNEIKVNALLDALIRKDFVRATELIAQGNRLWDIDKTTFERALWEFLTDYDVMKFLVNNKFNKFCFRSIECINQNNKSWGIVARAYIAGNKKIVELLFSAGFEIIGNGLYVGNDGNIHRLWQYCLVNRFDKDMIDMMLSYGEEPNSLLLIVDDDDLPNNYAATYIRSKKRIVLKGYGLANWEDEIKKPAEPKFGLFTSNTTKKEKMHQYEEDMQVYEKNVKVREKYLENISSEEWKFICEDRDLRKFMQENHVIQTVMNELKKL